jgi:hypothetical protein
VSALPWIFGVYAVALMAAVGTVLRDGGRFGPRLTPNILLLGLYGLIGYYLLRTQLANHAVANGWSLSGLALTVVFPTCGLMHVMFVVYATTGQYDVGWHGLVIDWLAVPAAIYFLWVVRSLSLGTLTDWNEGSTGARLETVAA